MSISILILAAGASTRMRGGDKLLEIVDGQPLIARQAGIALATGLPVTVALPPDRPARDAALQGLALTRLTVPDAAEGMAASIRAGAMALPPDTALLLLLADLPDISADDLRHLVAAWRALPGLILRATSALGIPGHPVIFPSWAVQQLAELSGDTGARDMLRRHSDRTRLFALPGQRAITDLDTPEDWAAWRAGNRP